LFRDCEGEEFKRVPPFWEAVFTKAGGNLNLAACTLDVFDDDERQKGINETNIRFEAIEKKIKDMGELLTVEEDYFGKKREVKVTVEIQEVEVNNKFHIFGNFITTDNIVLLNLQYENVLQLQLITMLF
jgi:hypothetical protein